MVCWCCLACYAIVAYIVYFILKIVWAFFKIGKPTPYKQPDLQKRFSKQEIPNKIDYIIIGSGMGGLVNAAILSKLGKKVLVLEQHTIAGGCCHTFTEKGYEFDTGFHYIGNKQDYLSILNFALSKKIEWNTIKQFDNIMLNDDKPFMLRGPQSLFIQNIKDEFPDMTIQIDAYFEKMFRSQKYLRLIFLKLIMLPKCLQWVIDIIVQNRFLDLHNKTVYQVQEEVGITKNKRLTAILSSQYMDIGMNPKNCNFCIYSGLFLHYTDGAIYPKGGPMQIVESVVATINHYGGQVLTGARVKQIIIADNAVQGVILQQGVQINCKNVISAIGLQQTINVLDQPYQWKINLNQGISHFYCFIGLKGKNAGVGSSNLWHLRLGKDYDIDGSREKYLKNMDLQFFSTFTSSSSGKDKPESEKQSVIMLAEAKSEWVEQYKINDVQRKEGYKQYKQNILELFRKEFCTLFPDQKENIDYIDLATPLTNEHYYGRYASYGLDIDNARSQDYSVYLKFTTKYKGLYLSGQDTFFNGIAGAIMSGFLSSLKIEKIF